VPVTPDLVDARFFVRRDSRLFATPLFVALVMVELTDVVFAVDSIPAILAVTRDPFLVFSSNAFAILGLRSLYFAVAGLMAMFRYIKYSSCSSWRSSGFKMLFMNHFHVPKPRVARDHHLRAPDRHPVFAGEAGPRAGDRAREKRG
jgi:tellurite resistance protein TerC